VLLSTALGLNKAQPMLDFVDIDLTMDFPLYIDPVGFLNPRDDFAEKCRDDLQDFFQAVLKQIASGNTSKGTQLLAGLREPNETHLGVSSGTPRGRGLGPRQAQQVMESLYRSPAGKTGLLTDLTDVALFIEGVGADKISDMTTNIIRRHLIKYTQQQFELHHIPIGTQIPTGLLWDTGNGRWIEDEFDRIPVVQGEKVLLVPKRYVRWRGGLQQAASKYYNNFVTNYIRDEELRTNGKLVQVIKTKKGLKRVVRKEAIKKKFPLTKDFLAEFSSQQPKEYEKFRRQHDRFAPVGIRTLVEAKGDIFEQGKFDNGLILALRAIATGRKTATEYHHLITGILTYIFYPDLISPSLEHEIDDSRKRIDLSFMNSADGGFFKDRKDDPFTRAREVTVECKNYSSDIANPEIDQMGGRFDPLRGLFGIIMCRKIDDKELALARCRDVFRKQRGLILILEDDDVEKILTQDILNRPQFVQNLLRQRLREVSR
jgi:hypothetical protein